jgi:hypothetical protein
MATKPRSPRGSGSPPADQRFPAPKPYDHAHARSGGRSRAVHEAWLARLSCATLRLEASRDIDELATAVTHPRP